MDALVLDIAVRILAGLCAALLVWGGWLSVRATPRWTTGVTLPR
jgi:hypothetical protein